MLHRDMSLWSLAMINRNSLRAPAAALSVSWNAFVAAFLYYALLAMLALGGASPGVPVVATAYLAPPVMYVVTLLSRAVRAGATWAASLAQQARIRNAH
jgi:hypothetical protein